MCDNETGPSSPIPHGACQSRPRGSEHGYTASGLRAVSHRTLHAAQNSDAPTMRNGNRAAYGRSAVARRSHGYVSTRCTSDNAVQFTRCEPTGSVRQQDARFCSSSRREESADGRRRDRDVDLEAHMPWLILHGAPRPASGATPRPSGLKRCCPGRTVASADRNHLVASPGRCH